MIIQKFLLLTIVFPISATAGGVCGELKAPNDVLRCLRDHAPELQSSKISQDSAHSSIAASRRWLNPELSTQSTYGKNLGNEQVQTEISLSQTIEMGAKRSARVQTAEAEFDKASAELKATQAEILIQGATDLYRLAQIKIEKETLNEAIETFTKLITQFSNRPRLSSEQDVSLAVFRLAKGDFIFRSGALQAEEWAIQSRFKQSLDLEGQELVRVLPKSIEMFPDIADSNATSGTKAPTVLSAQAAYRLAEARLSFEQGDPFSEIKLGPVAQLAADGPSRSQWFGFQLTLPFPVWNQNGYGKESATKALQASDVLMNFETKKANEERARLLKVYNHFQTLLKVAPTHSEMELKHEKIERLFFQGLVNSSLVIEAHRSLIDVQKSRNETELSTLNALWGIYRIDDNTSEIKLWNF